MGSTIGQGSRTQGPTLNSLVSEFRVRHECGLSRVLLAPCMVWRVLRLLAQEQLVVSNQPFAADSLILRLSATERMAGANIIRRLSVLHGVSSSRLGPVDPSFRALSRRLRFEVRRYKFNEDSLSLSLERNRAESRGKQPVFISHQVFYIRFAEVHSPSNLSTDPLLLLIRRINRRICGGVDFCKMTSKTLCVR